MKAGQDLAPERSSLHLGDEVLDYLEVDVGFQERAPYLAQSVLHVIFGEHTSATQLPENAVEFLGKVIKHGEVSAKPTGFYPRVRERGKRSGGKMRGYEV